MQIKTLVTMLAVNMLLNDQLLCSIVWVLSLGLNLKRSWNVIMKINIWQLQEKRIKKQWVKLLWWMICGSFMIYLHKVWMQEWDFCLKSCSIFHFTVVLLRQNFIGQLVWWYLIFSRTGTHLVWTDGHAPFETVIRMQFSSFVACLCSLST